MMPLRFASAQHESSPRSTAGASATAGSMPTPSRAARSGTVMASGGNLPFETHHLFDHGLYFRCPNRPYRPVAIVGEPYDTSPGAASRGAARLGLELHIPHNLTASWHYPGWTRFFCFTRPGTAVRFLPEQTR
jgi:hypothetical protein